MSDSGRQIPIKLVDISILDTEFDGMRERFQTEMSKMEEEMNDFESDLFHQDGPSEWMLTLSRTESGEGSLVQSNLESQSNWLNSPLIHDIQGTNQKQLKLRFDLSQFGPEHITVKAEDNKLLVDAKYEKCSSDGLSIDARVYGREFLLPPNTDLEQIRSYLSKDGILTVEAPLPQAAITEEKRN